MTILSAAAAALAWLGRQGTRAIAALVFIGLAAPPLDALLKPYVAEAIFVLLCIAFLRLDVAALRGYLRRPGLVLAATAWTTFVVPLIFGGACLAFGVPAQSGDLLLSLMLQAAAPPMMAAPAFAALMGLDATLVLATLVASAVLTPVTAPTFAYLFVGPALTLSPLDLGVRLLAILAGAAMVAAVLRRVIGTANLVRHAAEIDGLNILVVFVFVASVMENVAARFRDTPGEMLQLLALAFAISIALLIITTLVFAKAGRERALALGFMASQRNLGLMLAATGGALPELAWLYFALSQFPIYLSPQLLKPVARHVVGRPRATAGGRTVQNS